MTIPYQASTALPANWGSGTSKNTNNITVPSGSGNVLIAHAFCGGGDLLNAPKWNTNETFILLGKKQNPGNEWHYMWKLENPTPGTGPVNITSTGSFTYGQINVALYTGRGTPKNFVSDYVTSTGKTITATVDQDSILVAAAGAQRDSNISSGGARRQLNQGIALFDSNNELSGGSNDMVLTWNSTTNVYMYVEIPKLSSGPTNYNASFLNILRRV